MEIPGTGWSSQPFLSNSLVEMGTLHTSFGVLLYGATAENRTPQHIDVLLSMTFDQKLRRAGKDYTFHWKGNALTDVEPKDDVLPLFKKNPYPIPPFNADARQK